LGLGGHIGGEYCGRKRWGQGRGEMMGEMTNDE
jgi:hypothetical protein